MGMIRIVLTPLMLALLLTGTAASADAYDQFQQAVKLSKQGEWTQAAELFQWVASEQSDWPEPKNNLAVVLLKLGQVEQARLALEQAIISQTSFKVAQLNRQKLYDYLAAKSYEKALGNSGELDLPRLEMLDTVQQAASSAVMPDKVEHHPVVSDDTIDIDGVIRQRVSLWSKAWSGSDVDTYLSCYSPQFKPFEQNLDFNQWRYQRRIRLESSQKVSINIDNVEVYLKPKGNIALVEFVQSYVSANYTDKVIKQLLLSYENDQWLITSERVLKAL